MATSARRLREIKQRENLILDVAREMLIQSGYLGLNMDRIAEATEYSKGTIYQHFSCKEEVVMAICIQSLEQQLALFERAITFQGRTREVVLAIGEAYDLFVHLYPHHFQSAQLVRSESIRDKTSPERQARLHHSEHRCMAMVSGAIHQGIEQGDLVLPDWSGPAQLTFGLWSMAFGAYQLIASHTSHTGTSASGHTSLPDLGIQNPRETLFSNYHILLDGVGWQPLSHVWDYDDTRERILKEVFPDEHRQVQLG